MNITKTYLPNVEKYKSYIDEIYENAHLTNNGPLVQRLERRLEQYLGVKNVVLVANGTLALSAAYSVLNLTGDVVTSPFSFVATTSSIISSGLNPIFSDIDPYTFNINPNLIKEIITEKTSAIVPVHAFGNPCNIDEIHHIAQQNDLKIVYDAAHAFNVLHKGQSVLSFGDISILSFHATKLFHTIEGGAMIISDNRLAEKARKFINFGLNDNGIPDGLGINAKMNEFEAAMGLCVLDDIDQILNDRKTIVNSYEESLGGALQLQKYNADSTRNYAYFPVVFESKSQLLHIQKELNRLQIFPRRYFRPSLNKLSYIEQEYVCPVSESLSSRILCLPLSHKVDDKYQKVIDTVLRML